MKRHSPAKRKRTQARIDRARLKVIIGILGVLLSGVAYVVRDIVAEGARNREDTLRATESQLLSFNELGNIESGLNDMRRGINFVAAKVSANPIGDKSTIFVGYHFDQLYCGHLLNTCHALIKQFSALDTFTKQCDELDKDNQTFTDDMNAWWKVNVNPSSSPKAVEDSWRPVRIDDGLLTTEVPKLVMRILNSVDAAKESASRSSFRWGVASNVCFALGLIVAVLAQLVGVDIADVEP